MAFALVFKKFFLLIHWLLKTRIGYKKLKYQWCLQKLFFYLLSIAILYKLESWKTKWPFNWKIKIVSPEVKQLKDHQNVDGMSGVWPNI